MSYGGYLLVLGGMVIGLTSGENSLTKSRSSSSYDMDLIRLYMEEFRVEIMSMKSQLARMARNSKLVQNNLKDLKGFKCPEKKLVDFAAIDCPSGFDVSTPTSCYKFVRDRHTWKEASANCRSLNSHLVSLESEAEQKFIKNHLVNSRKLQNCDFWTDASDQADEGVWIWNNTGHPLSTIHNNWHKGEPNNSNGNEHCMWMDWFLGWSWNDATCDIEKACYICEKDV